MSLADIILFSHEVVCHCPICKGAVPAKCPACARVDLKIAAMHEKMAFESAQQSSAKERTAP